MLSITGSGSLEAASSNAELQAVTADCFKTVIAESRSVEAVSNEQLSQLTPRLSLQVQGVWKLRRAMSS